MSLVKWKNNNSLFPSLSSVVDNFFNDDDRFFLTPFNGKSVPAVNVKTTESTYEVEVAAPGMAKEDFNIEVESGVLYISSEKEDSSEEKKEDYYRKEFSYSSFNRSFLLPEGVTEDDIKANYKDGVLCVSIPKPETEEETSTERKKIEIS